MFIIRVLGHGVASSWDISKIDLSTVFKYIEEAEPNKSVTNWLTPTLTVLLFKNKKQFLNFKQDANATCVHFAVKYVLITGKKY